MINQDDSFIIGNNKSIIQQLISWLKILISFIVAILHVLFKESYHSSDIVRWDSTYQQYI